MGIDQLQNSNTYSMYIGCIVKPEIFVRVLFSRNFAYAKFRENKILAKWRITLSDIVKSCPSYLTLFANIKFSRKFRDLQY